jgi:two-component system, NtrC family, sensor kinase
VAPFSILELLGEVESLRRLELKRKEIQLDLAIPSHLPHMRANRDQMRQVLLQVLDNAASDIGGFDPGEKRRVRIEAARSGDRIHILVSNSGPGFANPGRVFDPFFATITPGESPGLALSLCYSIVREQGGDMSALNLQPRGAAVVIEMPCELSHEDTALSDEAVAG